MKMRMLFLALALCPFHLQAQATLVGSMMTGDDNRLEAKVDDQGVICCMEESFTRGEGAITEIYRLDVGKEEWEIHGLGVATSKAIRQAGANTYIVQGEAEMPVKVTLGEREITLALGRELYTIGKKQNYLVEQRRLDANGNIVQGQAFSYEVAKRKGEGFIGVKPASSRFKAERESPLFDPEAGYYPKNSELGDAQIKASVFDPQDDRLPEYAYSYRISLSKSRDANLQNYLILLTQRSDRTERRPLIHPVLLSLCYFDALMAKE
jgi:hypothetical protein